ncbi:MAG: ABC transporter ATP-binding protein, partial [Lysobacterales bacterium]
MFGFFEKRVDPFPAGEPEMPPARLWPFVLHFSRPVLPWLALMSALTIAVSVLEVVFLGYMGALVDWLGTTEPSQLLAERGTGLLVMAGVVLLGYPLLVLLRSLVTHQTIFGNYPMLGRWLSHRWLLDQSLPFFQDEFAGRISQKVMQTALAVRETVLKLLEVLVYVAVYFTGALILVGSAHWLLMLPLLVWLAGYVFIAWYFVPRLGRVSMAQADARAHMTGRIVDSYTNIQTIKLFAQKAHEEDYARDAMTGFMDTVYRQMRLVTWLTVSLQTANALLLAGTAAVAIWTWLNAVISLGAIAVAITLAIRIRSMSEWVLWEIAGLFENIGTVQDGINTLTLPRTVNDRPDATELVVADGAISFDQVSFAYPSGAGVVVDGIDLQLRAGEKIGVVG